MLSGETQEKIEQEKSSKLDQIYWNERQVQAVVDLVTQGESGQVSGWTFQQQKDRPKLWNGVSAPIEFDNSDDELLFKEAKKLIMPTEEPKDKKELADEEHFTEISTKGSEALLKIIEESLRGSGLWNEKEYRRLHQRAGTRRDGKKNYSQEEILRDSETNDGLVTPDEGGPQIQTVIYSPSEETEGKSLSRIRRSLVHEASHTLRALTNNNLWEGFEDYAAKHKLRISDNQLRSELVGGYYTGSNKLGSESIGEFMSLIAEAESIKGDKALIKDVFPLVVDRLTKTVSIYEKNIAEGKENKNRNFIIRRVALVRNLKMLIESGHEDISARDLAALGCFGYTTFEKIPDLIRLGVLEKEKLQKMRIVIDNVFDYMNSESETGFRPNFQNT